MQNINDWVGKEETVKDRASGIKSDMLRGVLGEAASHHDERSNLLAPLDYWLHFTPTASNAELGKDGHPKLGGFMPPIKLPRRMWAGSDIEFIAPIKQGSEMTKHSTINSINHKTGSSGALVFVQVLHRISANNVESVREMQTIVYKEATPVPTDFTSAPPRVRNHSIAKWDWSSVTAPDEVSLFRFSALTYNSHRIHYDLGYATREEGYPGLVVHGPLTATLLLNLFQQHNPGVTVKSFNFKGLGPVFAGEEITIAGRLVQDQNFAELEAIAPDGSTAMRAKLGF